MFTMEELEALNRSIQTVHKAEKAIEILADGFVVAPHSKMEILMLEVRIQEEIRKLMEEAKKKKSEKPKAE